MVGKLVWAKLKKCDLRKLAGDSVVLLALRPTWNSASG